MTYRTLVRDVMRRPILAPEGMWFRELVRLLRAAGTGFLIVVDTRGRPVGAVTEEDLLLKLVHRRPADRSSGPESASRRADRRKASAVTARELMTEPLLSVAEALPAAEAAELMRRRGVRHLAVLDAEGWPIGALDRGDLLTLLLLRPDAEIRQDVEDRLARLLRERADSVGVEVRDGLVTVRPSGEVDAGIEEVLPDLLEIEGVLAARSSPPSAPHAG